MGGFLAFLGLAALALVLWLALARKPPAPPPPPLVCTGETCSTSSVNGSCEKCRDGSDACPNVGCPTFCGDPNRPEGLIKCAVRGACVECPAGAPSVCPGETCSNTCADNTTLCTSPDNACQPCGAEWQCIRGGGLNPNPRCCDGIVTKLRCGSDSQCLSCGESFETCAPFGSSCCRDDEDRPFEPYCASNDSLGKTACLACNNVNRCVTPNTTCCGDVLCAPPQACTSKCGAPQCGSPTASCCGSKLCDTASGMQNCCDSDHGLVCTDSDCPGGVLVINRSAEPLGLCLYEGATHGVSAAGVVRSNSEAAITNSDLLNFATGGYHHIPGRVTFFLVRPRAGGDEPGLAGSECEAARSASSAVYSADLRANPADVALRVGCSGQPVGCH